jgi:hypothetical protein
MITESSLWFTMTFTTILKIDSFFIVGYQPIKKGLNSNLKLGRLRLKIATHCVLQFVTLKNDDKYDFIFLNLLLQIFFLNMRFFFQVKLSNYRSRSNESSLISPKFWRFKKRNLISLNFEMNFSSINSISESCYS